MLYEKELVGYEKTQYFDNNINIDNVFFMLTESIFISDDIMIFIEPLLINEYIDGVDLYMRRRLFYDFEQIDFNRFI
jgi:hypothetical protein